MRPESRKLLVDILQACEDASSFVADIDQKRFLADRLRQAGIERQLEIMGEALNKLARQNAEVFGSIDQGHKIIGMRNVLAHGYDIVDHRILWSTVQFDVPKLLKEVQVLLR